MQEVELLVREEIAEILPEFDNEKFVGIKLEAKEILLAYHYILNDNNISLAYQEVYGEASPALARAKGNKIARKGEFKKALDIFMDEIWKQSLKVLPLKLMRELNAVSSLDIFDYYDNNMVCRKPEDIPAEKRKLINNIEIMLDKNGVPHYRYDLPDKRRVANTLLEILKAKGLTKVDDGGSETDSYKEAQAIREKILGGVI